MTFHMPTVMNRVISIHSKALDVVADQTPRKCWVATVGDYNILQYCSEQYSVVNLLTMR
jgi:hypothetical protein